MNIETIITVLTALGGFEAVKWTANFFMNRSSIKKKSDAEAEAAQLTNEKNQVGWLEDRIAQRDAKIDSLYIELRKVEDDRLRIVYEKHALELELKEANYNKCLVYDCQDRKPPRNTLLNKEEKK
ncbi:hypothetical protein [Parabacteroides pacaensis]|uniref:hypothetical protein n=1 Tax=Parabacteroides pacaensis TaxID=2086575 RepID=UPI000D0F9E90|nr:hypothetical protein [Parabacteroides pacaensis]